jgi:hypothetical protein
MWDLEAELKIGAMGYEEGYVSKVQSKKWEYVSVSPTFDLSSCGHVGSRRTTSGYRAHALTIDDVLRPQPRTPPSSLTSSHAGHSPLFPPPPPKDPEQRLTSN